MPAGVVPISFVTNAKWTNDFNEEGGIREGYQGSTWVYRCVKLRADSVASVPLKAKSKQGNEYVDLPDNHPLQMLLNRPNEATTQSDYLKLYVTHMDTVGNAVTLKNRSSSNGRILELYPLLPQYVTPKAGRDTLIASYKYEQPQAAQAIYEGADIIHGSYVNPNNLYWGQSPLMAAGKSVDIDNEGKEFQKVSFENRGVTDGAFSFDGDMSSEDIQAAQGVIKQHYQGAKNARAPLLLNKMNYISLGSSPAEMDFMNTREFTMKEIAAAYGVPSEMISGMGDANRASSDTVRKTFWVDTINPLLSEIENTLNLQLASEYGSDIVIQFDRSTVPALQESLNEKLDAAKKLFDMGVPFNVVNEKLKLGFDDIEGGNIGYLQSGLMPTDFNYEQPSDDIEEAAKSAYGVK